MLLPSRAAEQGSRFENAISHSNGTLVITETTNFVKSMWFRLSCTTGPAAFLIHNNGNVDNFYFYRGHDITDSVRQHGSLNLAITEFNLTHPEDDLINLLTGELVSSGHLSVTDLNNNEYHRFRMIYDVQQLLHLTGVSIQ